MSAPNRIPVADPFGATVDPALPTVARALDPSVVATEFKRGLPRLAGEDGRVDLKAIRVIRHKPGKRCVILYDVRVERPKVKREKTMLIGKVRARRFGTEGFRSQEAFWKAGFFKGCADGIAVPEPIGVLPAPTNVTLKLGERSGMLTVKASPVFGASIYNWRLTNAATGAEVQTGQTPSARTVFDGLTPGVTYTATVNTVGAAGPSDWSNPVSQMAI